MLTRCLSLIVAAAVLIPAPSADAAQRRKKKDTPTDRAVEGGRMTVTFAPMTAEDATPAGAEDASAVNLPASPDAPVQPAPTTTIAQTVAASPDHTTLERLVTGAQLAGTLGAPGSFTLFAPDDGAFSRLAPGTVDTLLQPENSASLIAILKHHVVPGTLTLEDLKSRIEAGNGTATIATLAGDQLTATMTDGAYLLTDGSGNQSYISKPDLKESNGVIHVVNGVVVPKMS